MKARLRWWWFLALLYSMLARMAVAQAWCAITGGDVARMASEQQQVLRLLEFQAARLARQAKP
jgi:hypothetical protein